MFGLDREDFKAVILFLRPDQGMCSSSVSPGGLGDTCVKCIRYDNIGVIYTGNGDWHMFELTKWIDLTLRLDFRSFY